MHLADFDISIDLATRTTVLGWTEGCAAGELKLYKKDKAKTDVFAYGRTLLFFQLGVCDPECNITDFDMVHGQVEALVASLT